MATTFRRADGTPIRGVIGELPRPSPIASALPPIEVAPQGDERNWMCGSSALVAETATKAIYGLRAGPAPPVRGVCQLFGSRRDCGAPRHSRKPRYAYRGVWRFARAVLPDAMPFGSSQTSLGLFAFRSGDDCATMPVGQLGDGPQCKGATRAPTGDRGRQGVETRPCALSATMKGGGGK